MAYHATFMTKYTTTLGPRTTVSVRQYEDGGVKICFFQQYFNKKQGDICERTVSLSDNSWYKFVQCFSNIDRIINDIGNGGDSSIDFELADDLRLRISASFPFINIRKFWKPPNRNDMLPTTTGVCLKFDEYSVLRETTHDISSSLNALAQKCQTSPTKYTSL